VKDVTAALKARRSVRKYLAKEVPEDVIADVLDCGRLAPTAMNLQPWLIGAAKDKALLKSLADASDYGKFIADAQVCFTVFSEKDKKYRLEDGSAAVMNIITACQLHGLGTCWVAGDKKAYADKVRQLLNVPENYGLIALIPAGYPAEEPKQNKKALEGVSFRDVRR